MEFGIWFLVADTYGIWIQGDYYHIHSNIICGTPSYYIVESQQEHPHNIIDDNLYYNGQWGWYLNNAYAYWTGWNAAGYDTHGQIADPLFANGSGTLSLLADFAFQSTSPALRFGWGAGGRSVDGRVDVWPLSLDYGYKSIGSVMTQTFSIINNGSGPLGISNLALKGADAGQFILESDDCSWKTLTGIGSSCQIQISFNPTLTGSKTAFLEVTSTDKSTPVFNRPMKNK